MPWMELGQPERVLDFGGGFGEAYRRAKHIIPHAHWAVVETPAMCNRAKQIATDYFKMFSNLNDAVRWLGKPDLLHCNGALQYTPNPEFMLHQMLSLQIPRILWYRTELCLDRHIIVINQVSRIRDNGPGKSPLFSGWSKVEYTKTLLPRDKFFSIHREHGYNVEFTNEKNNYIGTLK